MVGEQCVSSSCTDAIEGACEARQDGFRLEITARFSWVDTGGFGGCTSDCRKIGATCDSPPLAAGTYTVALGDRRTTLAVGTATAASACIPSAPQSAVTHGARARCTVRA